MTARYAISFAVGWLGEALRTYYFRDLQLKTFNSALSAKIEYFNEEGSDDILNTIITQTFHAGRLVRRVVALLETFLISLIYLLVAFIISPSLTLFAVVILGGLTVLLRHVIDPGYKVGEKVAEANERRQEAAQAGTQGIRDVRLFDLVIQQSYGIAPGQITK